MPETPRTLPTSWGSVIRVVVPWGMTNRASSAGVSSVLSRCMCVDQARQDGPARQRDRLMRRPVVGPDAGDPAVGDDDRRRFDPLGEDIDDLPAGQEQVGGLEAPATRMRRWSRCRSLAAVGWPVGGFGFGSRLMG